MTLEQCKDGGETIPDTYSKILSTLAENVKRVEYGDVSVHCKIHGGRITSICHSITNNRIEKAVQV